VSEPETPADVEKAAVTKTVKAARAAAPDPLAEHFPTLEEMLSKKQAKQDIKFRLDPDVDAQITLKFVAIPGPDFDALVAKYPPTQAQKADGDTYDGKKFAPALLAAVCKQPAFSVAEWTQVLASENWSRGETADLFFAAMGLCNRGLQVGPTEAG
jgi:hypothetical protein